MRNVRIERYAYVLHRYPAQAPLVAYWFGQLSKRYWSRDTPPRCILLRLSGIHQRRHLPYNSPTHLQILHDHAINGSPELLHTNPLQRCHTLCNFQKRLYGSQSWKSKQWDIEETSNHGSNRSVSKERSSLRHRFTSGLNLCKRNRQFLRNSVFIERPLHHVWSWSIIS